MKYQEVHLVPNAKHPQDLMLVANGQTLAKIYGLEPGHPNYEVAHRFKFILENSPLKVWAGHTTKPVFTDDEKRRLGVDLPVLELTYEMSVPPDFVASRLNLWQAEHQRDLVAEIRGTMEYIYEDRCAPFQDNTDAQLASSLMADVDEFRVIPEDVMQEAVRRVREMESA